MALPIPNLDDRSFEDLINEAKSLIPIYNKDWTNHNPSDPGITLLELFAWLCEMVIYRIDQIPEESYRRFLKLIGIDYLFCWDLIPGSDTGKLIDFLVQSYSFTWASRAEIEKSLDGKTMTISKDNNLIRLELLEEQNQVVMAYGVGNTYEFPIKKEVEYLFDWDKIPGKENYRLIEFLGQNYAMNWVKTAKIKKSEDKKTIGIMDELNTITLQLDTESSPRVTMNLDVGNRARVVIQKEPEPAFIWNNISTGENAGADYTRLITLLTQKFGVTWTNQPRIEKSPNGKTIIVWVGSNPILLKLNDESDRVIVNFIVDGLYQFTVEQDLRAVFDWNMDFTQEEVRCEVQRHIVRYLVRNYGLYWLRNAPPFEINKDNNLITFMVDSHKISLKRKDSNSLTSITFNAGNTFEFPLIGDTEYLFDWDQVPGKDTDKVRGFLTQNYNSMDWVKSADVKKIDECIMIVDGQKSIIIQRNGAAFNGGNMFKFPLSGTTGEVFDWDQVPGNDTDTVREYLIQNYDTEWLKSASVNKLNECIMFADGQKSIIIQRNGAAFNAGNIFEFPLSGTAAEVFDWDQVPGNDTDKLRGYLIQNYDGMEWINSASVNKLDECIMIADARKSIIIQRNGDVFNAGNIFKFSLSEKMAEVFDWAQVPGDDTDTLREYLIQTYDTDWVKAASVYKLEECIMIADDQKSIIMQRNAEGNQAMLFINTGYIYKFWIKKRLGNLFHKPLFGRDGYLFAWDQVPGIDTDKLLQFLSQNYNTTWVENGSDVKSDGQNIEITEISNDPSIIIVNPHRIIMSIANNDEVTLTLDTVNIGKLWIKKQLVYAFDLDQITLEDRNSLLDFLYQNYGLPWLLLPETQVIFNYEKKTIVVSRNQETYLLGGDTIALRFEDDGDLATILFNTGNQYQFDLIRETSHFHVFQDVKRDIRRGLKSISQRYRAITAEDFEFLARECMDGLRQGLGAQGRAICINNRDLEYASPNLEKPGHVSVIVIPKLNGADFIWETVTNDSNEELVQFLQKITAADWLKDVVEIYKEQTVYGELMTVTNGQSQIALELDRDLNKIRLILSPHSAYEIPVKVKNRQTWVYGYCAYEGKPTELLKQQVLKYLEPRRLITTRVHVVAPNYREMTLEVHLVLVKNINEEKTLSEVSAAIYQYFDPLTGGPEVKGWPLGRWLYRSEIYHLIEKFPGIDHVTEVLINSDSEQPEYEIEVDQLISLELIMKVEKRYHG
jgi:hypothetical protein